MNRQAPQTPSHNQNPLNRKRPDPALLRTLRGVMLTVGAIILLAGLLLLILPMFRVNTIKVEGNGIYSAEEIVEASGILEGQELLTVNTKDASHRIYEKCHHVESVKILCTPFSVKIEVKEFDHVMYTEFNGKYISLNRDFRVLEESESADAFAGFLYVELPEIAAITVGSPIRFENADADLSYVNQLIDELDQSGTLASVTSLDVSQKYGVSYVMDSACRVELGRVGETDVKLMLVGEILAKKGGVGTTLSVIDVSDPQKPTYRQLSSSETLLGTR
ncbi:MAG: FtsQ-type POTRA domain-containing protein [Clostridia bacterium]|nr:FtsQ-type POTRA domain-containing protein [Clostridia bacterium]